MDSALTGGLVAVGAVVLIALLMRAIRPSGDGVATHGPEPPREPWHERGNVAEGGADGEDSEDDDSLEDGHVIAVTSDGAALIPDRHAVRLLPPEDHGEAWKVGAGIKGSHHRGEQALAMSWHASEFTGIRVVRGNADEGPWRVEALGRDGEYTAFVFETREGADAAQKLFEDHHIVQLGEDEDGNPAPPSPEQFVEARRVYLETEAALELPDDQEPR